MKKVDELKQVEFEAWELKDILTFIGDRKRFIIDNLRSEIDYIFEFDSLQELEKKVASNYVIALENERMVEEK